MLFYAGEIQNSNKLPKAGNGNVFFPSKRVRFARADKTVAPTVPQPVKHRHQRMYVEVLP